MCFPERTQKGLELKFTLIFVSFSRAGRNRHRNFSILGLFSQKKIFAPLDTSFSRALQDRFVLVPPKTVPLFQRDNLVSTIQEVAKPSFRIAKF